MNERMEKLSVFDEELNQVMQGICPKCGSQVSEECTNQETQEWTVTCSLCEYVLVFEGV